MASRPIDHWLPSLDRARSAVPRLRVSRGLFRRAVDLWTDAHIAATQPRAAIVLRGRVVRRSTWTRDEELSQRVIVLLESSPAPHPALESRTYTRLLSRGTGVRCSGCPIRRGYGPCARCSGTGVAYVESHSRNQPPIEVPCSNCDNGFARCAICEGSGTSIPARVEYLEDRLETFASVLVPDDVTEQVASHVRDLLAGENDLPEVLAIPLDRDLDSNAAYRGPSRDAPMEFHGFVLGSALRAARQSLAQFAGTGNVAASEHTAFARPFLAVRFEHANVSYDAAVLIAPDGEIVVNVIHT